MELPKATFLYIGFLLLLTLSLSAQVFRLLVAETEEYKDNKRLASCRELEKILGSL